MVSIIEAKLAANINSLTLYTLLDLHPCLKLVPWVFAPNSPSRPPSNPNRRLSILGSYCLVTSFHFFRSHSLPTILTSLQVFVSNTKGNKYNKILFFKLLTIYIYITSMILICCSKSIEKCMLYISKIHWNLFPQMKYWYNRVFF